MGTSLETIRGIYESFARGDVALVIAALSQDVSWTEAAGFPYGGTYSGPDEVLQKVFIKLGTEWEGFAAIPEEFVVQGDTVVALGEYSERFSAPFAHVWKLLNGKVVRFRQYTDTAVVQTALN